MREKIKELIKKVKEKIREKTKGLIYKAGVLFFTLAVLFSSYMMLMSRVEEREAAESYEKLAEKVGGVVTAEITPVPELPVSGNEELNDEEETVSVYYPALNIDVAALKEINPDFRGWLYFPVLDINYPVVQGTDNEYYLKRSFEGEKMNAGCIFMDCDASGDWSDRNTFLFGHNMRDGSMFGTFKKLMKDPMLCKEDPYFYIYTEDAVYIYEIFSYYQTQSTSDRYMTFTTDETYDTYTEWAVEHSEYISITDLSERKNIVSMSTCYGAAGTSKRIMVHGVQIAVEYY